MLEAQHLLEESRNLFPYGDLSLADRARLEPIYYAIIDRLELVGNDPSQLMTACRARVAEAGVVKQALDDYQQLVDNGERGRDLSALIHLKQD